jgi:hypothetical protein
MRRSDSKSLASLKKAFVELFGKENPTRTQLDELGQKAANAIGRQAPWTGKYLQILLNSEKYNAHYKKPKFVITQKLLNAVYLVAKINPPTNTPLKENQTQEIDSGIRNNVEETDKPTITPVIISCGLKRRIENKIKRGCGQGEGKEYIPWLTVREVPSCGQSHRLMGLKTQRMQTFFSTLEKKYFLWAEYFLDVDDIREQYPLSIEETIRIAQSFGIRHPVNPKTHEPTVMTSDFVFTFHKGMEKRLCVRSVKPSNELEKRRVLEKLEIEEHYWRSRNIDWAIVTEKELPATIISNIELLRRYVDINDRIQLSPEEATNVSMELRKLINQTSLQKACRNCDNYFGIKRGTSQMLAFHLMAINKWTIDLKIPIALDHRLIFLDELSAL